jgi:hypothetical protein
MNINQLNNQAEMTFKLGNATLPTSAEVDDLGDLTDQRRSTPNFQKPHQLCREEGIYTRATLIQRCSSPDTCQRYTSSVQSLCTPVAEYGATI